MIGVMDVGVYGTGRWMACIATPLGPHEYQMKHAHQTDVVRQGVTTDEVTKIMGLSDTRIELGPRTILVYDDLRLVFDADALADAQ